MNNSMFGWLRTGKQNLLHNFLGCFHHIFILRSFRYLTVAKQQTRNLHGFVHDWLISVFWCHQVKQWVSSLKQIVPVLRKDSGWNGNLLKSIQVSWFKIVFFFFFIIFCQTGRDLNSPVVRGLNWKESFQFL